VARTSGVVWARAYGKADLEFDIPATATQRFKLGSVSKVLTATTAAKLAVRGVIDLDAPISTMLPNLPEQHRATTLKQLLSHRGGVRHYTARDEDRAGLGGAVDSRAFPTNDLIMAVFINDPLVAQPGTASSYSTYGYTLASLVMEAAAKKPFLNLIADEIAKPFGLGSLEPDDPISLHADRVSGYGRGQDYRRGYPLAKDGWVNVRQVNPAYKWAGGGFVATPSDIARFGAAHLDAAKVTAAERALLFTPLAPMPPNGGQGLGWRIDKDAKGRTRWHHAGNQEGGRASLVVYPDLGLSIAFATNVASVPLDTLAPSSEFADVFLNG
jgi:CubicO group peptidase (beta-lactamase class C family)